MAEQNKRIQFLQDALRNLAKSVREVSNGLIDLDKIISKLTGKTKEFAKEQQQAAQAVNRVGKNLKDTSKTVEDYGKKTDKATKSSKGFFGGLGKNLKTIISFYGAYQLLNAGLQLLNQIFVVSAKKAIAFEKSLADLRAVAGLTSEEVSVLRDVVFEVAGVTSLTALEVVELQKQLAKLGASTDEISKLTKPIALLSQALGEDAGGVAATLKKTLNQFQATSEEAEKFANILTGAVNETALSMDGLGTALSYVGPLGAQLGVSFEETAALLGILADNGFKASKAGTGLRNFFAVAAKDGRPFNEFLEDIASKNIDAAEAFELFGKIGASQALVISENVERFKDLTNELNETDRLFKANAVQMATTEGQFQILNSAIDKTQTKFGEFILDQDIFISAIALFDRAAAGQALAYRVIANATDETTESLDRIIESQTRFNKSSNKNLTDLQMMSEAFDALGDSVDIDKLDFLKEFNDDLERTGDVQQTLTNLSNTFNEELNEASLTIRELINITYQRSKSLDDAYIAQEANNESVKRYKEEYSGLLSLTKQGINVDKEKAELTKQIDSEIEALQKASFKAAADRDFEQQEIIVKRIALLKEQKNEIKNLSVSDTLLAEIKKKQLKDQEDAQKAAFKSELDRIKSELDAEVDAINAVTNTELEGAQSAEEAAQIRLKQEKLVQAAYANSMRSVEGLRDLYPEFISQIDSASASYEKFSKFTQSEIGKEGVTILKDYKKSFEDLGKQLKNETITLAEYEAKEDALEASLISSITTLKNSTEANQELKDMLDKIVVSYLNAKKSAEDYQEASEETEKTVKALGQTFVVDLSIEEAVGMALASTGDMISKFNDTALENTKNRLESEKDEISARYEVEQDILKSQLDNQLITESQYRQKQKELRKAQIAEENSIDKKIFESEKKRDRQNATTGYLQALASIIPNLIVYDNEANPIGLSIKAALSGALATAAYGAELAAIGQRKFFPKKFADGGMVNGPSHDQGGVPFSVQGRGGYEMEGGEFIVNKDATSRNYDLLRRINDSTRVKPTTGKLKFAEGGFVSSPLNESVDYLKAIAEATTSTAIGVSKPVRAYVADKDLRGNATERRIRDRNDRI
jgi:hypothetical protein